MSDDKPGSTLKLPEVAGLLHKSLRQVRYMVRNGDLPAHKVRGRYVVLRSDLHLPPDRSTPSALDQLTSATKNDPKQRKRYSVTDLRAFEAGRVQYRAALARFGPDDPVPRDLHEALTALSLGCHAFEQHQKAEHYEAARGQVARVVAALLLHPDEDEDRAQLAEALEREVLPLIAGLLRRTDKDRRRGRFRALDARSRA